MRTGNKEGRGNLFSRGRMPKGNEMGNNDQGVLSRSVVRSSSNADLKPNLSELSQSDSSVSSEDVRSKRRTKSDAGVLLDSKPEKKGRKRFSLFSSLRQKSSDMPGQSVARGMNEGKKGDISLVAGNSQEESQALSLEDQIQFVSNAALAAKDDAKEKETAREAVNFVLAAVIGEIKTFRNKNLNELTEEDEEIDSERFKSDYSPLGQLLFAAKIAAYTQIEKGTAPVQAVEEIIGEIQLEAKILLRLLKEGKYEEWQEQTQSYFKQRESSPEMVIIPDEIKPLLIRLDNSLIMPLLSVIRDLGLDEELKYRVEIQALMAVYEEDWKYVEKREEDLVQSLAPEEQKLTKEDQSLVLIRLADVVELCIIRLQKTELCKNYNVERLIEEYEKIYEALGKLQNSKKEDPSLGDVEDVEWKSESLSSRGPRGKISEEEMKRIKRVQKDAEEVDAEEKRRITHVNSLEVDAEGIVQADSLSSQTKKGGKKSLADLIICGTSEVPGNSPKEAQALKLQEIRYNEIMVVWNMILNAANQAKKCETIEGGMKMMSDVIGEAAEELHKRRQGYEKEKMDEESKDIQDQALSEAGQFLTWVNSQINGTGEERKGNNKNNENDESPKKVIDKLLFTISDEVEKRCDSSNSQQI